MLIPVQYHKKRYPKHIRPQIDEIAGHFDIPQISPARKFSLHTEYSYGKRNFKSEILKNFSLIVDSQEAGVPKLWQSKEWALEFAKFVELLCGERRPTIIEIHPPFTDYMESIEKFLDIYKSFEKFILIYSPKTKILIENRSGTMYRGGKFLISRGRDLRALCNRIGSLNLKLKVALDIPQLLTAYGGPHNLEIKAMEKILYRQFPLQRMTYGVHLWGKKRSKNGRMVSHVGDLKSYFEDDSKKELFLNWLADFLDDGIHRYFVPEVNSSDADLYSIIYDLEKMNIKFQ
jgi:hypothetical protein